MSSPVDVPGRTPPQDSSTISTSPNNFSFIDCTSPSNYNMHAMADALARQNDIPVPLITGEVLEEVGEFPTGKGYLTNYRLIILYDSSRSSHSNSPVESIAIGNIDAIDSVPPDQLLILCKDARVIRVQTSSTVQACSWYKKLSSLATARPANTLFALTIAKRMEGRTDIEWCRQPAAPEYSFDEQALFTRWGMDPDYFDVVDYNDDYSICPSYPRNLMVPKGMDRREIESLRDYRMLGRIPAVVWHCPQNHVLLLRASQPRSALLNWRNDKDEKFLRLVTEYTSKKKGQENYGRIKIFDCRSYMAAVGNRIKGGGSEREENYSNMKLEYCNLPNIHNVRYTFVALRSLFNPPVDQSTFLSSLQATSWLNNIVSILSYSNKAAEQLEKGRNVLIHCSDGWDRTTQLVTLAKILVDPFYRTRAGLEELIRRDWIGYGHKFSDRNGITSTDNNERCPVFLQWLDALHQVHHKYPTSFEYSMAYLVKLAAHTSSGLFTSFSFNTVQEMETVFEKERVAPFPIWRMLNSDKCYENALYDGGANRARILAPDNMQTMRLWNEVYRCQEVASLLSNAPPLGEEEREKAAANWSLSNSIASSISTLVFGGGAEEGKKDENEKEEEKEEKEENDENEENKEENDTVDESREETGEGVEKREESGEVETESARSAQAERDSATMERSMVKSRSSESIASTSESQNFTLASNPHANPAYRAVESDEEADTRERRNTRTSLSSGIGEEKEKNGGGVNPSSSPSPDYKSQLDQDGLIRFIDTTQETARKKFAAYEESVMKKEETERQRMRSEMSDVSIRGVDDEPFLMDDIMSDASVVDEHEIVYTPKHIGTQMNATHCSICRHPFNFINTKLNCNSCGRAVCARCSPHSYKETVDGVAKSRKACNECYSKMHSTPTPLTPSTSHSSPSLHPSPSNPTRSCPDGETRVGGYQSPSQAVKG